MTITHEQLLATVDYNCETGIFTFKARDETNCHVKRWNTRHAGTRAGSIRAGRYYVVTLFTKTYHAARLAWFYVHKKWPKNFIDHINGIKSDDRLANLREADRFENGHNRRKTKKNTSGAKGVYWEHKAKRWRAHIQVRKKKIYIGHFKYIGCAALARLEAEQLYFGEFARDKLDV